MILPRFQLVDNFVCQTVVNYRRAKVLVGSRSVTFVVRTMILEVHRDVQRAYFIFIVVVQQSLVFTLVLEKASEPECKRYFFIYKIHD